ncbi:MAG: hypothetical protein IPG07_12130 [Crocinitomicaceae bacterium]|nr:hypothetical protein [Crocinitomicaceae bacterium]
MKKVFSIFLVLFLILSCGSNSNKKYGSRCQESNEDSAFQAYQKIQEDEEQREHNLLLESELGRHNHYKNETLILDTVLKYDQGIRNELALRVRAFGRMSKEVNEVYPIMRYVDSVNCLKVTKILDEHGWLGATEIGSEGNSTLFLVIQHSDLQVQEKYLPMMRQAVEDGNAEASALAFWKTEFC